MNPTTARSLRRYSEACIPLKVNRGYPAMHASLYKLLKRWWRNASAQERRDLRRCALFKKPLPETLKVKARDRKIIVEWPPLKRAKPAKIQRVKYSRLSKKRGKLMRVK